MVTSRNDADRAAKYLATHLRAVIGFSMGAQQAFQWAVRHPDFMDRVVATSGTAKTHLHGVVRLEGAGAPIFGRDPFFPFVRPPPPPGQGNRIWI